MAKPQNIERRLEHFLFISHDTQVAGDTQEVGAAQEICHGHGVEEIYRGDLTRYDVTALRSLFTFQHGEKERSLRTQDHAQTKKKDGAGVQDKHYVRSGQKIYYCTIQVK